MCIRDRDIVIILKTIKTMLTKASSKGLKEDKTLNELLNEQDKIIISEIGAANIEE